MSVITENVAALSRRQSELNARREDLRSTPADPIALADAQAAWQPVYASIDADAPAPRESESVRTYQRRLAAGLAGFSPKWRAVDLYNLADPELAMAAEGIRGAVKAAIDSPIQGDFADPSQLRKVVKTDEYSGQLSIEHRGPSPLAWMARFMPPKQFALFQGRTVYRWAGD